MKGCLVFFGVLIGLVFLAIAGSCGFFVYKVKQSSEVFDASLVDARTATDQAFAFARPPTSRLDSARFDAALGVRERTGAKFQGAFEEMEKKSEPQSIGEAFGFFSQMLTSMNEAFTGLPGDLRHELEAERMSFAEFTWNVQTAYGTVFTAADRGDADAKALEDEIREQGRHSNPIAGGAKKEDFERFREQAKASLTEYDPASLAIVLAAKERFPGRGVTTFVDMVAIGHLHEATAAAATQASPPASPPVPAPR